MALPALSTYFANLDLSVFIIEPLKWRKERGTSESGYATVYKQQKCPVKCTVMITCYKCALFDNNGTVLF